MQNVKQPHYCPSYFWQRPRKGVTPDLASMPIFISHWDACLSSLLNDRITLGDTQPSYHCADHFWSSGFVVLHVIWYCLVSAVGWCCVNLCRCSHQCTPTSTGVNLHVCVCVVLDEEGRTTKSCRYLVCYQRVPSGRCTRSSEACLLGHRASTCDTDTGTSASMHPHKVS